MMYPGDHHLIDIDMLFDLRYSLCAHLDRSILDKVIEDGRYFIRDSDRHLRRLYNLDEKSWYDAYTLHFKDIFRDTLVTNLYGLLIPLTNRADDVERPANNELKRLTINFPYGYPDKEIVEDIVELMKDNFYGYYENIYVSDVPHSKLKLADMSKQYTDYFCYNWSKWMELNYEHIRDQLSPRFRLHVPELRAPGDLELDEQQRKDLGEMNIFDLITYIHIPNMSICWLPKEIANFYIPDEQKEEEGE